MNIRTKLTLGGLGALLAIGGLVMVPRDPPPPPVNDFAYGDSGSGSDSGSDTGGELVPYTAYFCCPTGGGPCVDVSDDLNMCPASHKLVSCGCPASEPDGSVSCSC